ncbi:hypothetical protein [Bradyrhizobium sp. LM2.9]
MALSKNGKPLWRPHRTASQRKAAGDYQELDDPPRERQIGHASPIPAMESSVKNPEAIERQKENAGICGIGFASNRCLGGGFLAN